MQPVRVTAVTLGLLLLLVESLKTCFAFLNIKPKPFFGLQSAAGTHPGPLFYSYIVSVKKKLQAWDGCHNMREE